MKIDYKKVLLNIVLPIIIMILVAYSFTKPTFQGKIHSQSDVSQSTLITKEANDYYKNNKELLSWTNTVFGGMPLIVIQGKGTENVIKKVDYLRILKKPVVAMSSKNHIKSMMRHPFVLLFINFLGFFIFALCVRMNKWLGLMGALAYGLMTYTISSLEAAHYTKIAAMGLIPTLVGGLYLIFSKRYLIGAFVLGFHLVQQLLFFHLQISFYTLILLLVLGLYFGVKAILEKNVKHLIVSAIIILMTSALAVLSTSQRLFATSEFSKYTMRGGSDLKPYLTKDNQVKSKGNAGENGLDRDYAFQWSYGIDETLTLLIPNYKGGSSNEKLDVDSKFVETLVEKGVQKGQARGVVQNPLPTYFGKLPFTSGPVYMGSILMFLFVFSIIYLKHSLKWPLIIATGIAFILAWGKHLGFINNLLFDYLPYYNKFRTPMMAFVIAQFTIPTLALLSLNQFLKIPGNKKETLKQLKLAGMITGGIILLFGIIGSAFFTLTGPNDAQIGESNPLVLEALVAQRKSMVFNDSVRSLIFIGLAFGLMWFFKQDKLKDKRIVLGVIVLLVFIDMWGVAKRYLPTEEFKFKIKARDAQIVEPTPADSRIMQDKTLHYRVFDVSTDPFNDNRGAQFHKMIGGYHPAKLSRYQDLINYHLSKYNQNVLDMLNTRYIIGRDKNSNQTIPQFRPSASGNAWFVDSLILVDNPLQEIESLGNFNPRRTAFSSKTDHFIFESSESYQTDSTSSISLIRYHPDTMVYESENSQDGLAVFSEIWYPNWRVFIDNTEVKLGRVNYVLRAIKVPAGKHQIKFVYSEGKTQVYASLERWTSIIILLLLPLYLFFEWRRRKEQAKNEPTA